MARRLWLAVACIVILAAPAVTLAQEPGKVWRVGFLSPRRHLPPGEPDYYDEVPAGLRALGYVEGKNLQIEWRFAEGKYDRLTDLAAELVKVQVDLILADGTTSVVAAQRATSKIPIVFGSAADPVGSGLVKSLARPGGNTTGVSLLGGSIVAKQLEMLRSVAPGLHRIAVLVNPDNPFSARALKVIDDAARSAMVQVTPLEIRSVSEVERAFERVKANRIEAFIFIADAFILQHQCEIAALAKDGRLPGIGHDREYPKCGGLMSYGSDYFGAYRRAATYVDKILRGANPGDLPVEQPTRLELVLNRKTEKALSLVFPPELLVLADKVID